MPGATLPAPVGGWNTFDGVVGMDPQFAPVLDNFIPEQGRLRLRPGYRTWASGLPGRVDGLMGYASGTGSALFASSGTAIYDVTVAGAVGAAVVTGLMEPRCDGLNVAAAGGTFLLVYNGVDQEKTYNGAAWTDWTGTGLGGRISWANVFKGQLFVGRRTKLSFWYGTPAGIGGAFVEFPLQGVAKRGGGVAGAIGWTIDGGQGPDDYFALVTTEGEVITYRGTNPASPATWALVGTFSIPRPLGRRFLRSFGGDVVILTEGGLFPLSAVVSGTDAAALPAKAFTRRIEATFQDAAFGRGAVPGWDITQLTARGLWILNVPGGSADASQVVFRAATGACARMLGLPASCWIETADGAYFGHAALGQVLVWGSDTSDNGAAILAECITAFSEFGASAKVKQYTLAQPILGDAAAATVRLEMVLDYALPLPGVYGADPGPAPPALSGTALRWDVGSWDVGRWGGGTAEVSRAWRTVAGIGPAAAVRLRLSSSEVRPEWLGTGVIWVKGGPLR